jgi:hypothetical protein
VIYCLARKIQDRHRCLFLQDSTGCLRCRHTCRRRLSQPHQHTFLYALQRPTRCAGRCRDG